MGFSSPACPPRDAICHFTRTADKQGIGREKPLNDFLIKPQIRAEQPYYLRPRVIYSPGSCSVWPTSAGHGAGGEKHPACSPVGHCLGTPGQAPPASSPKIIPVATEVKPKALVEPQQLHCIGPGTCSWVENRVPMSGSDPTCACPRI